MFFATQVLQLKASEGEVPVPVRILVPEETDGHWRCRCEIGWPDAPWADEVYGVDAVQAVVLALHNLGTALEASEAHASGRLIWPGGPGGYGFPVLSVARDHRLGDDRMLIDPASIAARRQRDQAMSRDAAKTIVNGIFRQMDELGELLRGIEPLCSSEEFDGYRRGIGQCLGTMVCDVLNPVMRRYPDLQPPEQSAD